MSELRAEVRRKAFHMLSLVYLAAYWLLGYPRIVLWLTVWCVAATVVETARLGSSRVRAAIEAFFTGIMRESEKRSFSGIFHTSWGCLGAVLMAGDKPRLVSAALLYLALGDAAAALAGKRFGRTKVLGGPKSLEGTAANFAVCLACGLAVGLRPVPALGGAAAAAAVELIPNGPRWNDNLWLPIVSTGALLALGAS